ncbi:MAG: hypothetical protein LUG16_07060 [Candidatus Gastranaerophilales bacterium]|nr:hypothetical protein [Candidatus Gastranaerophilales bacterium]
MEVNYQSDKINIQTYFNRTAPKPAFKGRYDDSYNSRSESDKNNKNNTLTKSLSDNFYRLKTNLWLSTNPINKRNLKAFLGDIGAYTFELRCPIKRKPVKKEIIAETMVENRKNNEPERVSVQKVSFDDNSAVFSLNIKKDKLAFIDVVYEKQDSIYINYVSTIQGNEEYRGLFKKLLNSVIEDSIVNGNIPEIEGQPGQVGNKEFDRASLYKFYGAKKVRLWVEKTFSVYEYSVLTKEKIIEMMDKIKNSNKKTFILKDTEEKFDELKKEFYRFSEN